MIRFATRHSPQWCLTWVTRRGKGYLVQEPPKRPSVLIVVGPRAVLEQYAWRPWSDVVAAATRGDDGLALSTIGQHPFSPIELSPRAAPDQFALREFTAGLFQGYPSLYRQGW